MADIDAITLGAAKSYVKQSLNGVGALKGAPCEIQNTIDSEDSHTVVFGWEDKLGTMHESQLTVHDGKDGENGQSAYQIAVENGFDGTEEEWLASLRGVGVDGKSAYEIAVQNGFEGTEAEWLESLKGGAEPTDIDWSTPPSEDDVSSGV